MNQLTGTDTRSGMTTDMPRYTGKSQSKPSPKPAVSANNAATDPAGSSQQAATD